MLDMTSPENGSQHTFRSARILYLMVPAKVLDIMIPAKEFAWYFACENMVISYFIKDFQDIMIPRGFCLIKKWLSLDCVPFLSYHFQRGNLEA
jgi:hypothetical protein